MTEDEYIEVMVELFGFDKTRLGLALGKMEKTDPVVASAAKNLRTVLSPHDRWRRDMVNRIWSEEEA